VSEDFWNINGIYGSGPMPSLAGKYNGLAIVLGSAACLWDDLSGIGREGDMISVSAAGCCVIQPMVKHWCNLHAEYLPHYQFLAQFRQPKHIHTHTQKPSPDAEFIWEIQHPYLNRGTSAMFATLVGLALGYTEIILAGCPLDNSAYFYEPPSTRHGIYPSCLKAWEYSHEYVFNGRVKSMSGKTMELLGRA
jgi:hypothetical protein